MPSVKKLGYSFSGLRAISSELHVPKLEGICFAEKKKKNRTKETKAKPGLPPSKESSFEALLHRETEIVIRDLCPFVKVQCSRWTAIICADHTTVHLWSQTSAVKPRAVHQKSTHVHRANN